MAFTWPYRLKTWRTRRSTRAVRQRGKAWRAPDIRVRGTPLLLAVFLAGAYSASWAALMHSTLPVHNPAEIEEQLSCLALNIYHEARGEPSEGKLAVAHVVLNRVADHRFPGDVCAVVQQGGYERRWRCQFTWWCDGRSDHPSELPAWEDSLYHARKVMWRATEDPTRGALWYHADHVSPAWRKQMTEGPKIGKHIFYTARSSS